jgi:uncharacterized protein (TIGR02646 family)
MIRLAKKNLPGILRQNLQAIQKQVDAHSRYEEQVKAASRAWDTKDQKTFNSIRDILEKMCPGVHRCVYCEDARGDDIEHFHPKKFYPEQAFVWDNYLLACSACNSNYKRDKFAILDSANQRHDLKRDKHDPFIVPPTGSPLLINPRKENPFEYLRIDIARKFEVFPLSHLTGFALERANYTIEIFQLNRRSELVRWRMQAFRNFIGWIDSYATYKLDGDVKAVQKHITALRDYSQLSVWLEMCRVYQNRNSLTWEKLISKSDYIRAIDRRFGKYPELLTILSM